MSESTSESGSESESESESESKVCAPPTRITAEQQRAVGAVLEGRHIQVVAMPGSGKSRLAYELIQQATDDATTLMLVYNRALNVESAARLARLELGERQAKTYTFHGLVSAITGTVCCTDQHSDTSFPYAHFSLLIIDECQDVRPTFFRLIRWLCHVVCQQRARLRVVLLGDPRQLLYDFYNKNRADERFLTLGAQLLHTVNHRVWDTHCLTQSFRSTYPIAVFLNTLARGHTMRPRDNLLGVDRPPVEIIVCDIHRDIPRLLDAGHLAGGCLYGVSPSETMLLCSSLNARSPIRPLVKLLASRGIPVSVKRSGDLADHHHDDGAAAHGVRCSTFCATKGLEARVVIVVSDRPLFVDPVCENSLYVALSRSNHRLVIFQAARAVCPEALDAFTTRLGDTCQQLGITDPQEVVRLRVLRTPMGEPVTAGGVYIPRRVRTEDLVKYMDARDAEVYTQSFRTTQVSAPLVECLYPPATTPVDTLSLPDHVPPEGLFDTLFTVPGVSGGSVGLLAMACTIVRTTVEFHLLGGRLPRRFGSLHRQVGSPYVQDLCRYALDWIKRLGTYSGHPGELLAYIQPIAAMCAVYDADTRFYDKIFEIRSFAIFACPAIAQRIQRTLTGLLSIPSLASGLPYTDADLGRQVFQEIRLVDAIPDPDQRQQLTESTPGGVLPLVVQVIHAPFLWVHNTFCVLLREGTTGSHADIILAGLVAEHLACTAHLISVYDGSRLDVQPTTTCTGETTPTWQPTGEPTGSRTILPAMLHNRIWRIPATSDADFVAGNTGQPLGAATTNRKRKTHGRPESDVHHTL
jgi:hypothetical protein